MAARTIQRFLGQDARVSCLSAGCQACLQGRKTVLFITGICPRHCFYCPLSEEKWLKDDIYANEWKIGTFADIVEEIRLCKSTGVGITGGDPLVKLDRTAQFIAKLKQRFGKDFHIHLYTSLTLLSEQGLAKLHKAGLDEIRVHPDLDDKKLWSRIGWLKQHDWDVTIEIPILPDKEAQTKELMLFAEGKIDYLNLNELEMSHTNAEALGQHGFRLKTLSSHGVKGSQELALRLVHWARDHVSYAVHYCSSRTKDWQMGQRIKLRAASIRQPFDIETEEGTILRGALYLAPWIPGTAYHQKLSTVPKKEKDQHLAHLRTLKTTLHQDLGIPEDLLMVDPDKLRIITSVEVAERLSKGLKKRGLVPAFVEEYPTKDALEVQVQFL